MVKIKIIDQLQIINFNYYDKKLIQNYFSCDAMSNKKIE